MDYLNPRSELLSWHNPSLFSSPSSPLPTGAVELWELDENSTLIVSKFCNYKHDDIMSTVSALSSGTQAVSGSKDFWWVPPLITPVSGPPLGVFSIILASLNNVLGSL